MRLSIDKAAQDVVQLLHHKQIILSTAESCTGGLLSGALTGVSGSSQVFNFGICAYANEVKQHLLGVNAQTLAKFGAVSAECAAEMAVGARRISNGIAAISVTGIAGPGGGTAEKPTGTVYFACSFRKKLNVLHLEINPDYGREYIRLESVRQALILILNTIS